MENFTPVSGLIGSLLDKRRKFLKAVYDLAQGRPTAHVSKADVALRLDMDVGDREGFDEFMAIGQYLDDLGCICTFQNGAEGYREYGELGITGRGIDKVEEVEESARSNDPQRIAGQSEPPPLGRWGRNRSAHG